MSQNDTAYTPETFKWKGKEYPFDFRDADDAEKYEAAYNTMKGKVQTMPKDGKASTILRWNCRIIREFFDEMFGEGAGIEICGEKDNLGCVDDAFKAFMTHARGQSNEIQRMKNDLNQIAGNRQQRHDQQRNGKKKQGYHNRPQEQRPHNGPTPVK